MTKRHYYPRKPRTTPDDVAEILYAIDAVYDCSQASLAGLSFAQTCRGWIEAAPTPRVRRCLQEFMARYVAGQRKEAE